MQPLWFSRRCLPLVFSHYKVGPPFPRSETSPRLDAVSPKPSYHGSLLSVGGEIADESGLQQRMDDSPSWDDLESRERVKVLEDRFLAALEALERGVPLTSDHVFVAQGALTSMRAELYGYPAGRARHRNHELRLARALGQASGGGAR